MGHGYTNVCLWLHVSYVTPKWTFFGLFVRLIKRTVHQHYHLLPKGYWQCN